MKKNKMEVQLRSYCRPGRSFNTLSNPSSKFKGNRNKKFVCNLKTKSGKFQKALNAQIICAFPVIYDIKPSREGGYLFPCPPPPQIKIILFQKKLKICFLMLWCPQYCICSLPPPLKFSILFPYTHEFFSCSPPQEDIGLAYTDSHRSSRNLPEGVWGGVQAQLTSFDRILS